MQHAHSTQPHATTKQAIKASSPCLACVAWHSLKPVNPHPQGKGSEASLFCQWTRRRGSLRAQNAKPQPHQAHQQW